jgi:hypothetical protein
VLIDTPTTAGVDPTTCAQNLAAFVKANDLDGVNIDYEDNNAFNTGVAEAWLISTYCETCVDLRICLTLASSLPDSFEAESSDTLYHFSCSSGSMVHLD